MESGDPDTDLVKYSNCFHDGVKLQKAGQYAKAVLRFDKAMDAITPNGIMTISEGRHCLTARSECHLALGDHKKAYDDAEASLEEDPNFIKGLLAKANALYVKGSFEYALVFYHRGHALRPELDEFTLGISKTTEAIENSVGSADTVDLEKTGDMTLFHTFEEIGTTGKPSKPDKKKTRKVKEKPTVKPSEKTVKQLLGELYSDREYLENLLQDPSFITLEDQHLPSSGSKSKKLPSLINGGLKYLDGRTEFWRQQKPIYSRKKDAERLTMRMSSTMRSTKGMTSTRTATAEPETAEQKRTSLLTKLENAHNALDDNNPDAAYQICDDILFELDSTVIPGHKNFYASVRSTIGDCFYMKGMLDDALEHYEADLETSSTNMYDIGCNRALTNLGRTHSSLGNYDVAIKLLQKIANGGAKQRAWKAHEIGRCFFELHKVNMTVTSDAGEGAATPFDEALRLGEEAYNAGLEAGDHYWAVSGATLVAQVHNNVGKEGAEKATHWYEAALAEATKADNPSAISNIEDALDAIKGAQLEN